MSFLCRLFDPGRVAVAQILPDQPGCSGSTFDLPAGRQRLHAWIEARQHKANIYYALNEPVPEDQQTGANGRVGESDIARIRGVAVDLDPHRNVEATPGGFERERERLMGIADSWGEVGVHQPSAVVDSGGGVQAIWLFPEPLQATPDVRTAVKAQGKGLARFYGGDAVQSVDHLFRIPFTVNLPDRKKRARGRLRALSRSLHLSPENRADLDALAQLAPPVAAVAAGDSGGVNVSDARSVLGAPEDLNPDLIERIAAARENAPQFGRLLDGALPNQDRSSRDFAIATACVEHGIGDATDIADVVAAYSPEKFEERGEAYLARTVAAALAQAKPRPSDPSAYFERIEPETPGTEQPTTKSPIAPLTWIDPTAWEGRAIPTREWEVPALIPKNEVTLVYGDGGIGKTLLMHQYATCAATGRPWLGQLTRKARVMGFLCEDDEAELHRRQNDINRALGVGYAELADLRIVSRKHDDNLMAVWDRQTGRMKLTEVWRQLKDDAVAWGADVLILDTIADIYGGSEIDRAQVNAFVKSCLGQLAQAISGSVIALGHPSQSGKNSGEGTSGSSAWSNAARSRLFLRYPETKDRKTQTIAPTDIRELENKKLNYGPRGALLKLRWVKGAFEPITASVPGSVNAGPEQSAVPRMEDAAENAVVAALLSANGQRLAMAANSPFYAPKVLRQIDPEGLIAFSATEVFEALVRLERRGGIRKEEVGRDSSSRPIYGFVVIADRLSKSIAESGQEVIDGDPRTEADPVTD